MLARPRKRSKFDKENKPRGEPIMALKATQNPPYEANPLRRNYNKEFEEIQDQVEAAGKMADRRVRRGFPSA
jgi:hypothetical protein